VTLFGWRRAKEPTDDSDEGREKEFERRRHEMVRNQIERRDVRDPAVLTAMREAPRHRFIPESLWAEAYEDSPLPIGYDQTISQPYIVALMTQLLQVGAGDTVLEVGTGSGYQAAILAHLGCEVFTIEIVEPLAKQAETTLRELGCLNVHVLYGDGYDGYQEHAPFDGIIATAAPDHVPQALVDQLKGGRRLVLPVGYLNQDLYVIEKTAVGLHKRSIIPVRFVPMTGRAESGADE
jgi:protein-L-isoaspartate(D-aspartate) O-methyltransferase